jgi:hypothetical protein
MGIIKISARKALESVATAVILAGCWVPAQAASVRIAESPAAWRLENYPGGIVTAYFTSVPCSSGQIVFGANAVPADLNRFWATVSLAKATGQKMFVYYENANAPSTCVITSFGLDAN